MIASKVLLFGSSLKASTVNPGPPTVQEFFVALAAAYALIFLFHADALFLPPTGDQAMGIWLEGVCLERTNFDYYHLRFEEQTGVRGGPSAYVISVLPSIIAVLIKICPSPVITFVVFRLFTFLFAALGIASLYQMARFSLSPFSAASLALLCLTTPLFSAQSEILGMDTPMTGMACLAILLLACDRPALALGAAAGCVLFKATGAMAAGAIGVAAGVLFLRRPSWGRFWTGAASCALVVVSIVLLANSGMVECVRPTRLRPTPRYILGGIDHELFDMPPSFFHGPTLIRYINPDLVLLAAFAAALSIGAIASAVLHRLVRMIRKAGALDVMEVSVRRCASSVIVVWVSSIALVIVTYLSIKQFYLPRYALVMVPFLCLWFAMALHAVVGDSRILHAVLCAGVVFNLLNQDGRFFPSMETDVLRPYAFRDSMYEGSLQYRRPLQAQIKVAKRLEEEFADADIVTQCALGQQLALPELGLVSQPLHGYCFDLDTDLIPQFPDLVSFPKTVNPNSIVFAATRPTFDSAADILAMERGDETIMTAIGFPRLVIYRKSAESMSKFAARLRLNSRTVPLLHAKQLFKMGLLQNAQGFLEETLTFDSDCAAAELGLAYVALAQHDQKAVHRWTQTLLARNPDLIEPVVIEVCGFKSIEDSEGIADTLIRAFQRFAPHHLPTGWDFTKMILESDDRRDVADLQIANRLVGGQLRGMAYKAADEARPASFRRIGRSNAAAEINKLFEIADEAARKCLTDLNEGSTKSANRVITLMTLVCDLTRSENASFLDTLASGYALDRNFEEAARIQEVAVARAVAMKVDVVDGLALRGRLDEYRRLAAASNSSIDGSH